ncbi:MAG TPA: hypothetical protein PLO65_05155 [Caulobacter sp.]|nr:hypothetical protein [Caulobacter sp.]
MTEPKHDTTQADKFRDLARELECDEDEGAFEATVKKVAKAPKPEKADSE